MKKHNKKDRNRGDKLHTNISPIDKNIQENLNFINDQQILPTKIQEKNVKKIEKKLDQENYEERKAYSQENRCMKKDKESSFDIMNYIF